jgi:hypothetical protein
VQYWPPGHQLSAGHVTTLPSGSTVFPGGTKQLFPSAEKVVPAGQVQTEDWQVELPRQTAPHAPQLVFEVAVSMQLPLQHETVLLVEQVFPQVPQLFLST